MPFAHVLEDTVVPQEGGGEHRYRAGGPYRVSDDLLARWVSEDRAVEVGEDFVPPPPRTKNSPAPDSGPKALDTKAPKGEQAPAKKERPKPLTAKAPKGERKPKDE